MADPEHVETVERLIPSPPGPIFDLIADPSRHQDIDGSGTVREAKEGSRRLQLGDSFGMSMKLGVPYSMVSTVIEYDENRRLAWQTRPPGIFKNVAAGRIWRYELEPIDGGTLVKESWDLSEEKGRSLVWRGREKTRRNMEATLDRIEDLVTR